MRDPLDYLGAEMRREARRLNAAFRAGDITALVHDALLDQLRFVQVRLDVARGLMRGRP